MSNYASTEIEFEDWQHIAIAGSSEYKLIEDAVAADLQFMKHAFIFDGSSDCVLLTQYLQHKGINCRTVDNNERINMVRLRAKRSPRICIT